jgi:predicted RNase H-related nuclease YkuK (DUF458 family)
MVADLAKYVQGDQKRNYTIVVGTDSQRYARTDFVTAIVVHRVGAGGRYFWVREQKDNIPSLRQRIYLEALKSLEIAQLLTKAVYQAVKDTPEVRFNIEIHVDIGENGKTREMIKEVVGMIRGNGYEVKTKPFGYGAFVVADRHT